MDIQPSYMAAATHIDTSSYWVTRGSRTAAAANKRALAGCTAVMGEGCEIAETVYGFGPLGVVIDAMGLRWIKSGGNMPTNYFYDNIEVRVGLRQIGVPAFLSPCLPAIFSDCGRSSLIP